MKRIVSERIALIAIVSVLAFFALLHLLIMLGILPFDMIWGGRLKNRREMLRLESISFSATLLMLVIVGIRAGVVRIRISQVLIRVVFGIMFLLFILNTLGNAASISHTEQMLFTPLTFVLAICCLQLALYPAARD